MKQFKFLFVVILVASFFTACNKDKDDVVLTIPNTAGIYEGKYGNDSDSPSFFYSFNLKADGTMEELNATGTVIGTGTWTLVGNTVRATHHYTFPANEFFVSVGTYDPTTKTITGTWGYGSSDNDGGKWYMTRK